MTPDQQPALAACWLCEGKGAVAKHLAASEQFGKTLFVPHRPVSNSHPVHTCPACGGIREASDVD